MIARSGRSRPRTVLVFGESENDTHSVRELVRGLWPGFTGAVKPVRRPPVYDRNAASQAVRSRVARMCQVVAAERATSEVIAVLVHRDCDDVEPSHKTHASQIETEFRDHGVEVVPVTPAWEFEAWLFLWPAAVAAYRNDWRSVESYAGRQVGLIRNAKEEFRRAVRAPRRSSRDYRESDAPEIVRKARELGIIPYPRAQSDSFQQFRQSVGRRLGTP